MTDDILARFREEIVYVLLSADRKNSWTASAFDRLTPIIKEYGDQRELEGRRSEAEHIMSLMDGLSGGDGGGAVMRIHKRISELRSSTTRSPNNSDKEEPDV